MGIADWDSFVAQAWTALKPGGWLELQEFYNPLGCDDGTATGTAVEKWGLTWRAAASRLGIDLGAPLRHADQLRARGFAQVREVRLKSPIGPWAKGSLEKEVGAMGLRDLHEHVTGLSLKLFAVLGYSPDVTTELCEAARKDMMNPKVDLHRFLCSDFLRWIRSFLSLTTTSSL